MRNHRTRVDGQGTNAHLDLDRQASAAASSRQSEDREATAPLIPPPHPVLAALSQGDQSQPQRPAAHRSLRSLRRAAAIGFALLTEVIRFRRFQRLSEETRQARLDMPQHFARTLMHLGPTFIKIGQILSTRPDFLPREYITALQCLQEHVPAFSFQEVQATLETALGAPLGSLFASFEEHPVASASLAQVHLAVLPDGSPVAVKVQRPGIRAAIEQDMAILGSLLGVFARLAPRTIRNVNLAESFQEFRRYTLQELDFVQEANTLERFQHNFRDWPDIVIPHVHWDQTTSTVLTMSRVAGSRLQEVVATASLQERRTLSTRLLDLEMKMFVEDGFFHADLHPGNIVFQEDGKIALLDFGMYGQLTEYQRDRFVLYLLAVVQKQTRRAFAHFISLASRGSGADEAAYYRTFKALAEEFYRTNLLRTSFTRVYVQMFLAGSRYGFVYPGDLLLHAKALTTAEALLFTLVPDLKFERAARPAVIRQYTARVLEFKRLKRTVEQWLPELLLFGELPKTVVREEVTDDEQADRMWTEIGQAMIEQTQMWKGSVELLLLVMKPFVRQGLTHLYPSETIDELVETMKEQYRALEPSAPRQVTIGADLNVHLAALTIAMYRVLLHKGHSQQEATQLVSAIVWQAYSRMGDVPWIISGKLGQDSYQRLRFCVDAFLTFPFGSPAYQWEDVNGGERVCAFNMTRCPVAEYFHAQGLDSLCVQTWCNQDFELARQWGGATLQRTGTLAGGAPCCDFRWRAREAGDGKGVARSREEGASPQLSRLLRTMEQRSPSESERHNRRAP